MPKIRTAALMPLLAVALAAPTAAFANSELHLSSGEAGYTFHPDHVKSTKTRAEVMQELQQAKADGSYYYLQRGLPVPPKNVGPGKTREEVLKELVNMTPEERARMNELYFGD